MLIIFSIPLDTICIFIILSIPFDIFWSPPNVILFSPFAIEPVFAMEESDFLCFMCAGGV